MSHPAQQLRPTAEGLGTALPPLLAAAEQLAATTILGEHGRRQAGTGDAFWQYRAAVAGDALRRIDWRRSGRGDTPFVRETEWQAAQSVLLWADPGQSMDYASTPRLPTKGWQARLLALALAITLLRGGERVGLIGGADGGTVPARSGRAQTDAIAVGLLADDPADYAAPPLGGFTARGQAVLVSDFLGEEGAIAASVAAAADQGVRGVLLQILDPAEATFPFTGRTVFESIGGSLRHAALRAADLGPQYRARLAARRDWLARLAQDSGWQFHTVTTDQPAAPALLWLYRALERRG